MLLGFGAQPDDREHDDADQHGRGEEVLQEAQRGPAAHDRNVELGVEQDAVGLEIHGRENEEAPHGEEVRHAGDGPLQQLGLGKDFLGLIEQALTEIILARALVNGGLTGPDEVGEPKHPLGGEYQHDHGRSQAYAQPDPLESAHRAPPFCSYPWVTSAMLLAGN